MWIVLVEKMVSDSVVAEPPQRERKQGIERKKKPRHFYIFVCVSAVTKGFAAVLIS